jgi:hypothetical protein
MQKAKRAAFRQKRRSATEMLISVCAKVANEKQPRQRQCEYGEARS